VANDRHNHITAESLLYSATRLAYFGMLAKELCDRFRPSTVLDIGCGSGQLVFAFNKLGVKAYGVDISEDYLSIAPGEVKGQLTCADIGSQKLPFLAGSFGLVIAHHSIEHFRWPGHFIAEAKRVLKFRGIVVLVTPTPLFEMARHLLRPLKIQRSPRNVHPSTHSVSFWVRSFEKNGFQEIGDLKPFIRMTCVEFDPPQWWVGQLLLKSGPLGKLAWRQLAPHVRGSAVFQSR
jgi:SAM-dependent methyltransferase